MSPSFIFKVAKSSFIDLIKIISRSHAVARNGVIIIFKLEFFTSAFEFRASLSRPRLPPATLRRGVIPKGEEQDESKNRCCRFSLASINATLRWRVLIFSDRKVAREREAGFRISIAAERAESLARCAALQSQFLPVLLALQFLQESYFFFCLIFCR